MTIAYGPAALPSTDSLGASNYTYVVRIPASALSPGRAFTTVNLKGPSVGQARIQAVYIGHAAGAGLDFDGGQVQLTRGGATSFSLTSPALVSLDRQAFAIDNTRDLLIAYRLLANDRYDYNNSAGTGFSHSWKSGTEDPGLTSKTGYTTVAGRTAMLSGLEVFDTASEAGCCCESHQQQSSIEPVLLGEVHSSGGQVGTGTGHLHFMLFNPTSTSHNGFLHQILVTPDVDTVATVRSYETPLANVLPKCNLMFGAGQGLMTMTYGFSSSLLGNFHSIVKLRSGCPTKLNASFPLVGLPPGAGLVLALHTPNIGATCNFEWQEKAI